MPILDLLCNDCKHVWEDLVRGATPDCPSCGSPLITRLISSKGPILIGAAQERIKNKASNPPTPPVSVYVRRK